jgi:hypothetical protein
MYIHKQPANLQFDFELYQQLSTIPHRFEVLILN